MPIRMASSLRSVVVYPPPPKLSVPHAAYRPGTTAQPATDGGDMTAVRNPGRVAGLWYLLLVLGGARRPLYFPNKLVGQGGAGAAPPPPTPGGAPVSVPRSRVRGAPLPLFYAPKMFSGRGAPPAPPRHEEQVPE